jgi:SOS-response transcriptional repressor LexA
MAAGQKSNFLTRANRKLDHHRFFVEFSDKPCFARDMIPFDEIDDRLEKLGLDRAWLANATKRSPGAIRSALAPAASTKHRSDKLQQILSDAIEREEASRRVQLPPPALPNRITVEPSVAEFDLWDRASRAAGAESLHGWALEELNKAADAWFSQVAPISDNRVVAIFPEVPLLRAAAGAPILADAEMVQPDHDLGKGRFLLELRGDSMEPRFLDRQRVVLRDKATLRRPLLKYGQFYCFLHEGAATFKEWAKDDQGRKVLRSLNPEHSDIPADEQTEWIGWFDAADNA